jgi:hypothetical protein
MANYLVAGSHTLSAEDTLIQVTNKRRMAVIYRKHLSAFPKPVNTLLLYAQIPGNFKQLIALVWGTSKEVAVIIGADKFHSDSA